MTIESIREQAEKKMQKCLDSSKQALVKIRTGRANTSLLDGIMVSYYGNDTPLNQVANVTVGDARTLLVTPWDKSMVSAIEKAIITSDLGLNPVAVSENLRIPLPALTEERRKELIRLVRAEGENGKVAVRNVRRDANTQLKDLLKKKTITEDDERGAEDKIQKLTDQYIGKIDVMLTTKETELMEI